MAPLLRFIAASAMFSSTVSPGTIHSATGSSGTHGDTGPQRRQRVGPFQHQPVDGDRSLRSSRRPRRAPRRARAGRCRRRPRRRGSRRRCTVRSRPRRPARPPSPGTRSSLISTAGSLREVAARSAGNGGTARPTIASISSASPISLGDSLDDAATAAQDAETICDLPRLAQLVGDDQDRRPLARSSSICANKPVPPAVRARWWAHRGSGSVRRRRAPWRSRPAGAAR